MIITLAREFGSGGRELGKRLSDELNIPYYDKEIISSIADNCKLDARYVEHFLEEGKGTNFFFTFGHSFGLGSTVNNDLLRTIMQEQCSVMKKIAEKDCIIVGRCADVLLKELNPFRIFVFGDLDKKIERCHRREPEMSEKEIEKFLKRIDKDRAKLYSMYSDIPWGDKRGYDLLINTSGKDLKMLAKVTADYIRGVFGK